MKLPKQWSHWCKKMNLRPHGKQSQFTKHLKSKWTYLVGRGRMWRLNMHGEFECGDKIEDFDRWSLSDIESVHAPTTESEFRSAVLKLELLKFISENQK